jgi:hypothetical protein
LLLWSRTVPSWMAFLSHHTDLLFLSPNCDRLCTWVAAAWTLPRPPTCCLHLSMILTILALTFLPSPHSQPQHRLCTWVVAAWTRPLCLCLLHSHLHQPSQYSCVCNCAPAAANRWCTWVAAAWTLPLRSGSSSVAPRSLWLQPSWGSAHSRLPTRWRCRCWACTGQCLPTIPLTRCVVQQ